MVPSLVVASSSHPMHLRLSLLEYLWTLFLLFHLAFFGAFRVCFLEDIRLPARWQSLDVENRICLSKFRLFFLPVQQKVGDFDKMKGTLVDLTSLS